MDLFLPESGLVIWMLIGFLIVFVILAKVGWPMIMGAVEKRNTHISDSLLAAEEANNALAGIEQKRQETMAAAQAEQIKIMKESQDLKNQLIEEAKTQARQEAEKIVTDTRLKMEKEQAEAMAQMKSEVVALAIDIAEKLLQRELSDKQAQSDYIEQMLKNNPPRIEA
ncbi:MAG: F0F1 ATP synthase subunit B [Bacteroidales bacterium]|nr:F0F1 ATP synthase subunit B [Bacteroidales bacterium]MBR5377514.1 F0F1 ATP synthase subunit B [Bacteroidales bacterium]